MFKTTAVRLLALLLPTLSFGAPEIYAPLNSQIISAIDFANADQPVIAAVGNHGTSVFVSPSGTSLFVTSNKGTITAFRVNSGQPVKTYVTTYPPSQVFLSKTPFAISSDESTLFVGTCAPQQDGVCQQGFLEVLDIATGVETGLVSMGADEVSGIAVSADGKTAYVTHFYEFDCGISCQGRAPAPTVPSNSLTAIALPALAIGSSVTFAFAPGALVMAQTDSVAYVGAADFNGGLAEVSLPKLTINSQITGLLAPRLALSADGTLLSVGQPAYNTTNPKDTVTFYRVPGLTLIGTVSLPYYLGNGLAADPQGRFAYTGYNDAVYQIDSQSLTASKAIATGAVEDLAISKTGGILYPLLGSDSSIATFKEGSTEPSHVSVLQPSSTLTFSPNGQFLYTTPEFPHAGIVPFSTATGTKLKTYLPNKSFTSTAISSDGSTLFAAAESSLGGSPFELLVLDLHTRAVKADIPLGGYPGELALSADGSKVVVNVVTGPLIYNVSTGTTETVKLTGGFGCAISPSGKIAYLQSESGNIAIVDLTTAKTVGTINAFGGAIAFSPVAPIAFASGANGEIAVIDTATGSISSTIATRAVYPQAFGITPDGQYLYVTGSAGGGVPGVVIDTNTLQVTGVLPAAGPIAVR